MMPAQPHAADRRRIEQCPQRLKRGDIRLRERLDPHRRASRRIEHPKRQFQQSTRRAAVMAAAEHIARRLLDHLMNMNDASCPWMPRIKEPCAPRSYGRCLVALYNGRRPHSSLDGSTPDQAYFNQLPLRLAA